MPDTKKVPIIFINKPPFAGYMHPMSRNRSRYSGMVTGFAFSMFLTIGLFSLAVSFTRQLPFGTALGAGVLFALTLIGGGALMRWYLR